MSNEKHAIIDGHKFVLLQRSCQGNEFVQRYVGINKAMNIILLLSILIPEWQAREIGPIIGDVSARYKIDPLLVSAVIYRESRFKNNLCFHGAHGLMQVQLKRKSCDKQGMLRAQYLNLYDDRINIGRGVKLLAFWKKWCKDSGHSGHHWLLHYNQGFGHCPRGEKKCPARDRTPITRGKIGGYARRVLRTYHLLKESYERSPTS